MKFWKFLVAVAPIAIAVPAMAADDTVAETPAKAEPAAKPAQSDTVTTGVAKGRDRLDSATSTSVLREADIARIGARGIGDLMRAIPGIRAEPAAGEGNASLTIRGLPIASSGAKFVQLQEDGLPVLEFGDIQGAGADNFLRADLNLSQVEVIRGGSASTFASNSPGGIINFISKTGDVEGGSIAVTGGLNFDEYRADFDYGARLTDSVRFHVGGFYRQGEGPRRMGYDAQKGGQLKLNVTKHFTGGYIRLYGKYLDDRTPFYDAVPMRATGTNAEPDLQRPAGFNPTRDGLLSGNIRQNLVLDGNNVPVLHDLADGQHAKSTAVGVESQFDLAGWTVTERFRHAKMSGTLITPFPSVFLPAAAAAATLGAPGGSLSYANGPNAGQVISSPSTLNGNGLIAVLNILDLRINDYANVTNDLRASRVWEVGGGKLTTTAGFYAARQAIDRDALWTTQIADVRSGGEAALVNITSATGTRLTQDGYYAFNLALAGGARRRSVRLNYDVNAPFASVNYHIGRVAIGGSLRYDYGKAMGQIFSADLGGGRVGTVARDINGDGVISVAEQRVGVTPLSAPAPVNYDYGYLSYSTGVNFRVSEPLAVFARYSRGARANADRILFSSIVSTTSGELRVPSAAYDPVKQAEAGVKFRSDDLTLNLTGFWAKAQDSNVETVSSQPISRDYEAKGLEFEGGYRRGIFAMTAGATYTDAEITGDRINPAVVGKTPRHQAKLIFQAMPQITTDRVSVGAIFIGTTDSYAQDDNVLKMPGFVTTNAFVQVRPASGLTLSLNANNLFDVVAINALDETAIPATGVLRTRLLTGRNVSATLRFDF